VASSRGQPDCWKPSASYLGKLKLNRGCRIFYQKGYVNIDRNREVRADRCEDISTLPSSEANCADEIYAGHVAEHVDDVKASFGRWLEVLKPGAASS
jgi:predicted SAM-dependent methyltransferase